MEKNHSAPATTPQHARRPYETPRLIEYGSAAKLTQDPQSSPRNTGPISPPPGEAMIFFSGDNA